MKNHTDKEKAIHVRRCHLCGAVNESEDHLVDQCSQCGKFFAPFVFFDEKSALGLSEVPVSDAASLLDNRLKSNEKHHQLKSQYPPIWGITVYWGT